MKKIQNNEKEYIAFEGIKIIVTNAFHKKTDKLPTNEKDRALKIKSDYEERIKRGDYYG